MRSWEAQRRPISLNPDLFISLSFSPPGSRAGFEIFLVSFSLSLSLPLSLSLSLSLVSSGCSALSLAPIEPLTLSHSPFSRALSLSLPLSFSRWLVSVSSWPWSAWLRSRPPPLLRPTPLRRYNGTRENGATPLCPPLSALCSPQCSAGERTANVLHHYATLRDTERETDRRREGKKNDD